MKLGSLWRHLSWTDVSLDHHLWWSRNLDCSSRNCQRVRVGRRPPPWMRPRTPCTHCEAVSLPTSNAERIYGLKQTRSHFRALHHSVSMSPLWPVVYMDSKAATWWGFRGWKIHRHRHCIVPLSIPSSAQLRLFSCSTTRWHISSAMPLSTEEVGRQQAKITSKRLTVWCWKKVNLVCFFVTSTSRHVGSEAHSSGLNPFWFVAPRLQDFLRIKTSGLESAPHTTSCLDQRSTMPQLHSSSMLERGSR